MIYVLSYHNSIQGSVMNLLDFHQYLVDQGRDVGLYFKGEDRLKTIIIDSGRPYKIKKLWDANYKLLVRPNDVVVTDFASFCRFTKPIVCRKLVIFDNAELSYYLLNMSCAKYSVDIDLEKLLNFHKFHEIEFLMPPCNYEVFKNKYDFSAKVFFKKINLKMLWKVKVGNNNKGFFRSDSGAGFEKSYGKISNEIELKTAFQYSTFYYRKRKELEYFEQLGRLVFEFIILGKNVVFEHDPMQYNDGMKDYIQHYGLDRVQIIEEMGKDYDYRPWD